MNLNVDAPHVVDQVRKLIQIDRDVVVDGHVEGIVERLGCQAGAPQKAAVVGCSHQMGTTHDRTRGQERNDGALPGPPELAGGCTVTSQRLSAGLASLRVPDWPVEV